MSNLGNQLPNYKKCPFCDSHPVLSQLKNRDETTILAACYFCNQMLVKIKFWAPEKHTMEDKILLDAWNKEVLAKQN